MVFGRLHAVAKIEIQPQAHFLEDIQLRGSYPGFFQVETQYLVIGIEVIQLLEDRGNFGNRQLRASFSESTEHFLVTAGVHRSHCNIDESTIKAGQLYRVPGQACFIDFIVATTLVQNRL